MKTTPGPEATASSSSSLSAGAIFGIVVGVVVFVVFIGVVGVKMFRKPKVTDAPSNSVRKSSVEKLVGKRGEV